SRFASSSRISMYDPRSAFIPSNCTPNTSSPCSWSRKYAWTSSSQPHDATISSPSFSMSCEMAPRIVPLSTRPGIPPSSARARPVGVTAASRISIMRLSPVAASSSIRFSSTSRMSSMRSRYWPNRSSIAPATVEWLGTSATLGCAHYCPHGHVRGVGGEADVEGHLLKLRITAAIDQDNEPLGDGRVAGQCVDLDAVVQLRLLAVAVVELDGGAEVLRPADTVLDEDL